MIVPPPPEKRKEVFMDANRSELSQIIKEANRKEVLVLWAIMLSNYVPHDAETDAATASYRKNYSNGEKKRCIRRCRIAQSALRRNGDADAVAVFERAIRFVRSEVLQKC